MDKRHLYSTAWVKATGCCVALYRFDEERCRFLCSHPLGGVAWLDEDELTRFVL